MSMDQNIVGRCPDCGAPVYAEGKFEGGVPPRNVFSCDCRERKRESGREGKTGSSGTGFTKYGWVGGALIKDA